MKLYYFFATLLFTLTVKSQSCDSLLITQQQVTTKSVIDSILMGDGLTQAQANLFKDGNFFKLRINGGGGFSTRTEMKLCLNNVKPSLVFAKGSSDDNDSSRTSISKDSTFVNRRGFNNKGWVNVSSGADSTTLFLVLDSKWGTNKDTDIELWLNSKSNLTSISYSLLDNNNDDFGYIHQNFYSVNSCNIIECNKMRLSCNKYPESSNIEDSLKNEISNYYSLADWNDLKQHKNINKWIQCMGFKEDDTFLLSKGGNRFYSGNRHYYVHYSSDGKPFGSFLVHDQVGDLYLGSWYGITEKVLAFKDSTACDTTECTNLRLSCHRYSDTASIADSAKAEFGMNYDLADWNDLKGLTSVSNWVSCMGISEDQTFLVSKGGSRIHSGRRHYYVHYSSDGSPYPSFAVHDQAGGLYLGSWYGLELKVLANKVNTFSASKSTSESKFSIYPIPTSDFIKLDFTTAIHITKVEIYSSNGVKVDEYKPMNSQGSSFELNVGNLKNGYYIMKVNSKDKSFSKGIVIVH